MGRLQPCPFCGKSNLKIQQLRINNHWEYAANCQDCGAIGPIRLSADAAQIVWNCRQFQSKRLLEAEKLIAEAVELMTVEQLSQWAGVRTWIEFTKEIFQKEELNYDPS